MTHALRIAPSVAGARQQAPSPPPPGAQIFDDPHVRTLSGNQFFLHGVGVFDYATIPGVIKTQVYMCPFAHCTAESLASGDCNTFIQAVAVQLLDVQPVQHTLIFRRASLLIDGDERKGEVNVTLGPEMAITASGTGRATELPDRVDHVTLTDCHVLATAGQLIPKGGRNSTQLAGKVARPIGGVWQACTRNEWTLSTPDMIVDVGVIGPFEAGYLRENVGDRTFNLDVKAVKDPDALQGIINGDKNGLFVLDPSLNPDPVDAGMDELGNVLVPEGPHGNVQEVVAANVAPEERIFTAAAMARMDAACGAQQSLRAIMMTEIGRASCRERV